MDPKKILFLACAQAVLSLIQLAVICVLYLLF